MTCSEVIGQIDLLLDRELRPDNAGELTRHLAGCDGCAGVLENRRNLRNRMRGAVSLPGAPEELQARIRLGLQGGRRWAHPGWSSFAIAAGVLLTLGTGSLYQSGHLRLTEASQEAYIAGVAPELPRVMQAGWKDHVHCAVFRKYPSEGPSPAALASGLGPAYRDLIPLLSAHIPREFHMAIAHLCQYQGRVYVHLVARDGAREISLLIVKRGSGEAFENELRAVASETGTSIYETAAQRFRTAGFETPAHLVYVVSDLTDDRNLALLRAMTPQLREVVLRMES